jgi:hypothetical protein
LKGKFCSEVLVFFHNEQVILIKKFAKVLTMVMIIATKRKCLNQLKSGADFLASTQEADLLLLGFILKTYLQARV